MRKISAGAATTAFVVALAGPATAHVTIQPEEVIAGGFQTFWVQVPTERENASTVRVEVRFPPLASVSFEDVPGWERRVEMTEFDEPLEAFGEEVTEGVGTVTWTGGRIEPGEFMRFPFSVGPVPEGELVFPAIQTYSSGEVVRWIGPPDADAPAGVVAGLDLGLEEGEGEISALAAARGASGDEEGPEGDDDGSGAPAAVSWAALGVGVVALVAGLARRKGA